MQRDPVRLICSLVLAIVAGTAAAGPGPGVRAATADSPAEHSWAAPAMAAGVSAAQSQLPPPPDRPVARVTVGIIGTTSDITFWAGEEKGWFDYMRIEPIYERF